MSADEDAPQRTASRNASSRSLVEAGWWRQSDLFDELLRRAQLPNDLKLFAECIILYGGQRYEMLLAVAWRKRAVGQCAARNFGCDETSLSDINELTLLRNCGHLDRFLDVTQSDC